jgi:hypothetical protein
MKNIQIRIKKGVESAIYEVNRAKIGVNGKFRGPKANSIDHMFVTNYLKFDQKIIYCPSSSDIKKNRAVPFFQSNLNG